MVGAKKWSKMKPVVENNLTTFFLSDMGTDFLTIDICLRNVDATIFSHICVAKNPVRRSPAAFTGYRLVLQLAGHRLTSFHADCVHFMQIVHFPVTGRLPAAFAGTRLVLQLLRLPAHNRLCMHGRPPAYTNACKAGYRFATDFAC